MKIQGLILGLHHHYFLFDGAIPAFTAYTEFAKEGVGQINV
jgi:hypothetical protein